MDNKLLELHEKQSEAIAWFEGLDQRSMGQLLVSTWQVMLWNPNHWPETLVKFYGHLIDGPKVMRFLKAMKARLDHSETYAWAVPNEAAIQALVEHSPLVEIGAGRGYWAALAAAAGADILAYDAEPPVKAGLNGWHRQPGTFHPVAKGGAEVAGLYPDRSLLLCWPPWNSDVLSQALRSYTGPTVIYIGDEGHNAGSPRSYAELADRFTTIRVLELPRWPGVECRMEIRKRADSARPSAPK